MVATVFERTLRGALRALGVWLAGEAARRGEDEHDEAGHDSGERSDGVVDRQCADGAEDGEGDYGATKERDAGDAEAAGGKEMGTDDEDDPKHDQLRTVEDGVQCDGAERDGDCFGDDRRPVGADRLPVGSGAQDRTPAEGQPECRGGYEDSGDAENDGPRFGQGAG